MLYEWNSCLHLAAYGRRGFLWLKVTEPTEDFLCVPFLEPFPNQPRGDDNPGHEVAEEAHLCDSIDSGFTTF